MKDYYSPSRFLGSLLGIQDYKTNMVSYWFLDTLTLQLIKYHKYLDEYYASVFVSWLAGGMNIIQDRKYTHKEFFDKISKIILNFEQRINYDSNPLIHWDLIDYDDLEKVNEPVVAIKSDRDPIIVLEKIMDSFYEMYGCEVRYLLIYQIFVQKISMQTHYLPGLKRSRLVKFYNDQMLPLGTKLNEMLRNQQKKGKKNDKKSSFTPPEPPANSLLEEEQLMFNRQYILPLIESNEASALLYARNDDE
ncbi:uncharacterized protein [Prorops nasuta]|uniref:uncharacterized protein n=1 Tax=Prorops nasuta TaxID=863751 RepID=UPI0034CDB95E